MSRSTPSTGRNRVPPLPLIAQLLRLNQRVPGSTGKVHGNRLVWRGGIRPTSRSEVYTVRIVLAVGKRPDITVLDPPLRGRQGEPLPHVFKWDRLCVYRGDQWNPGKWLADTIVPWIAEWLLHYEVWLVTGRWTGGGHEPRQRKAEPRTAAPFRSSRDGHTVRR